MSRNLNACNVLWMNQVKNEVECSRKVASGSRVAGVIKSLVNARDLQLECASLA